MKILEAKFQIVTPMFIGDANQQPSSLRPPSIKGALRFWWRALQWKNCLHDVGGVEVEALKELHQREATLFGIAADEDQSHGQSQFALTVVADKSQPAPPLARFPSEGHKYLLGQGLFKPDREGGQLLREPLALGGFTLKLVFKPGTLPEDQRSVAEAVRLWGLLGGLGSRSRKGFGSVAIQSLQGGDELEAPALKVPHNVAELAVVLKSLLDNLPPGLPPFTAFSKDTRIDVSLSGSDPLELLSRTGDQMQFYRSNGRGGIVRGKPAELTFRPDHDLAQGAAGGTTVRSHPRRVVFGLPHNYFFSSTQSKLDVNGSGGANRDRRASPLLIHAHRFPGGASTIVQSLLPAQFLPPGDQIVLKGRIRQNVPVSVDWDVLRAYLNRFPAREVLYGQP